ncbi:hypothetical protein RQP46_009502 [Phenoliferia psychrophenolica]
MGGLKVELGEWANRVLPEVKAVLNVPFFPELVGDGTLAPLTIHIHTSHHPDSKDPRRRFRIEYGEPTTKDAWVAKILREGYIVPSHVPKAEAGWDDPRPAHLRLLFTTLQKRDGVLPSARFSTTSFVSANPPETPSISAIDPANRGLSWAKRLDKILWDLEKSHSIVELETRIMVTFAGDERWRQRAVQVMVPELCRRTIKSLGPVELWTMRILGGSFRSNGADEKDVEAVALYSRFGGGMDGHFVPAPK